MCKSFKYLCAAALTLLSWGVLFRICDWPGGHVIAEAGELLGVVAALWAICGLKQFEKAGKTAVVVAAVAALLFFVGMFFHMMHLPGASIMLIVSMGVLIPLSAFWLACGCKCCKK